MQKEIIIKKTITCCDICGSDHHVHTCSVCKCDVCSAHLTELPMNRWHNLYVCSNCAKLDYTEYKALFAEIEKLDTQQDYLRDVADNVLLNIKNNICEAHDDKKEARRNL